MESYGIWKAEKSMNPVITSLGPLYRVHGC